MIILHRIFVIFVLLQGRLTRAFVIECESNGEPIQGPSLLGRSGRFPWLGVLRVHIHEGIALRTAVAGLTMISDKYALANTAGLALASKELVIQEGLAIFMSSDTETWSTGINDIILHPEYEGTTYNTIALVELKREQFDNTYITVVCIPVEPFYGFLNTTNLYVVRYTDERKKLEKIFHAMKWAPENTCKSYYNEHNYLDDQYWPTNCQCATSDEGSPKIWEDAMALISNATGKWNLIGVGIRSVGGTVPSIFIDVYPYMQWIETTMSLYKVYE